MTQFTHGSIIPLAGGFSIGATNIIGKPPEVIFSYKEFESNDKLYLRYLKQHNIEVPYYQINSKDFDIKKIKQYKNRISIVTGIPPCSGLSMCSNLKAGVRSSSPVNNWMYLSSEFILENISPTVFVLENAPGLFTGSGDEVRKKLISIGECFGYAITFKTNTLRHGLPQFRPRTFGIFVKGKNAPILNGYNKPAFN